MALQYLRQNLMSGIDEYTASNRTPKRSGWKFSKGRFSALLGGNLIIWVVFLISVMDINVFSMGQIPIRIPQRLSISGILYNEETPSVIISNQVYGVGDTVDGYTVNRITQTEVEFQKGDKTILRQVH